MFSMPSYYSRKSWDRIILFSKELDDLVGAGNADRLHLNLQRRGEAVAVQIHLGLSEVYVLLDVLLGL